MPNSVLMGVRLFHIISVTLFLVSCYQLCVLSQPHPSEDNDGALSIIPQEDQDNEDVSVSEEQQPHTENGDKKTLDVFYPTKEWQTVKPNQAIPKGLHVRMNMETGEREAKLLDDDSGPKYWNSGGKEGMVNTDKKYFTHEELKQYLKEFKVNKEDTGEKEGTEQIKEKFKSYEELKKDMEKLEMNIKTEGEIITDLVNKLNSSQLTVSNKAHVLEELEYYVHKIDNAVLFCDLGGMQMIVKSLNDTDPTIRSMSAFTIGSALQSNPKAQIASLEVGAMQQLIRSISVETDRGVRKKMLYAISSMIRHFPFAQKKFLELGGVSVLASMFGEQEPINIKVKVVTLLNDLLTEQNVVTEKASSEDKEVQQRIKQYKEVHLKKAIQEQGLCDLLPGLLGTFDHDTNEKMIEAMITLSVTCQHSFFKSRNTFVKIEEFYSKLAQDNSEEEEMRSYYHDILTSIKLLISTVSVKEEL